ncbi:unnamed protein product [Symbiodinium necroappetens]|uniref:CRAL-TRIO domain-containing protein n=1 Tax=Symbiodinium necroappetens TaxID=1628268 RepID=A0A812LTI0_9DINO|nr:unnamed protein product [Symbiodinium necroappetens]
MRSAPPRAPHSALAGALRPIEKESLWHERTHGEVSAADRARLLAAGLAEDFVAPVAALERFVEDWSFDLDDPLTLSRFLLGKPENLMEAKDRVTQARDWRAKTDLQRIMHEWGVQKDMVWDWEPQTDRAKALAPHFFGRCIAARTASGGPVIVLRLGEFDLAGAVREDMVDDLMDPWIFLIEQAFQDCRSVSLSRRSLVKLSAIVDVDGVNLSWLQHMSALQQFSRAINRNYPEMAATLTIVRAPVIFSWLWQISAPLLLEDMTRRKFAILGHDFEAGLAEHAHVDLRDLPGCLRGRRCSDTAGSEEAPPPLCFCSGARAELPPNRPWPRQAASDEVREEPIATREARATAVRGAASLWHRWLCNLCISPPCFLGVLLSRQSL